MKSAQERLLDAVRGLSVVLPVLLVGHIASPRAAIADEPLQALVEIQVRSRSTDLVYPWRRNAVEVSRGSGTIIEGNRILTAAHVVEDHVAIEARRHGTTRWYQAGVAHASDQIDLALLRVQDPTFFEGVKPLGIGEGPTVQDQVQVFGFPLGGEGAAVTRGIVSRVDVGQYVQSGESLLLAQIDAAINAGTSGGPVVSDDRVVGVALQTIESSEAENVGYVAPGLTIRHFLRDVEDGELDGVPRSGIWWQLLQSDAHREALGLGPEDGGVLVLHVDAGSAANEKVRSGDVLMAVDGKPVASDGTIEVPRIGRLPADYAFQERHVGDDIRLTLLRDRKRVHTKLTTSFYVMLIPEKFTEQDPPYLVFAGLVFQPLTNRYFKAFTNGVPPANLAAPTFAPYRTKDRGQIVVLTGILESRLNSTYRWAEDEIVHAVDGVAVRDLAHLAVLLDGAEGPYVDIALKTGGHLVFDLKEAREANSKVLAEYDAESDRSSGLRPDH